MKRNEIQSAILDFLTSEQMTAQEILIAMQLPFTVVAVRYHLDTLVMNGKIKSLTTSRVTAEGRNHKAVVYFK